MGKHAGHKRSKRLYKLGNITGKQESDTNEINIVIFLQKYIVTKVGLIVIILNIVKEGMISQ